MRKLQLDKENDASNTASKWRWPWQGWHWTGIALLVIVLFNMGAIAFFAIDHASRTNPKFCAACHNMENHVMSYLTSNRLDNVHFQANVGCKECHSNYSVKDEIKSGISFISGRYDDPMKTIQFPKEECLKCHRSYESLAQRTSDLDPNPHESHLGEVDCSICHKSHTTSEVYCNQCHQTDLNLQ